MGSNRISLRLMSALVILGMLASLFAVIGFASDEPEAAEISSQIVTLAEADEIDEPEAEAPVEDGIITEEPAVETDDSEPALDGKGGSTSITWSGASTITSAVTESDKTYTSTTADQNALLINTAKGVNVTLNNPTVTKSGGTSASDNYSFYGINSGIMCKGGGTTTIEGGTVNTTAAGANGIFCYGGYANTNNTYTDGTTVIVRNTSITTSQQGSGGIMTTGGGTTKVYNATVETAGGSSAAIRTDRGGGIVEVYDGTYKTTGTGSPAVYATATITVNDATLTTTKSQGIVNEGGNTVILNNCILNAGNSEMNGQDMFKNGIFLYQSMSGDARDGASVFTMTGGTINNTYGHLIHVTETSAAITLNNVAINNNSENVFLSVCDDGWSEKGKLGNDATLTANNQAMIGDVLVGSNSTATIKLTNGSKWTGTTSGQITAHKNNKPVSTTIGTVNVTLDSTSKWYLTADSYVTNFSGSAANVISNGYTLYVNGTPLSGTTEHEEEEFDPLDVNRDKTVDLLDAVTALRADNSPWTATKILKRIVGL